MSTETSLCLLPPPPAASCCDAPPRPPAAPIIPLNPPGLSTIRYRIGTFSSFRRAMLDQVPQGDLLAGLAGTAPNPFATWHEGAEGDYQTTFVELWAYLADILTFYQERIANEAYLPTSTQRDSLLRLASLVGYRPNPGAGAETLLAFTVERGRSITVPAGFRAGNRPVPGRAPSVFETGRAMAARGEHSTIPLSSLAPTNQFALLSSLTAVFDTGTSTESALESAAIDLYGAAGRVYFASLLFDLPFFIPVVRTTEQRTVVLQGTNTRIQVGDHVLVDGVLGAGTPPRSTQRAFQVVQVVVDRAANTTTIAWNEDVGTRFRDSPEPAVYALRVSAAPFGNNAPNWNSLPVSLKTGPYVLENWDDLATAINLWPYLPTPGDPNNVVYLDAVYPVHPHTDASPSWAVFMTGDPAETQVLQVTDARTASKAAYAISGKVTRLTLNSALTAGRFPLRDTAILAGCERLTLQSLLPLPDPLAGNTLILSGLYPNLQAGQTVVLRGKLYDLAHHTVTDAMAAESAILAGPPLPNPEYNLTIVTLRNGLSNSYGRAGAILMANVVDATQGETVHDEILGSGDGTASQSHTLKQNPLTYLAASGDSASPVQSTLLVTVNGVRWSEKVTLLDSGPGAQDFTTALDDSGQTTVIFGDGEHGARPPTGRDNIHAQYRKGLGSAGNLPAAAIAQLVDSVPGLQRVTNPQASLGGADMEGASSLRHSVPLSVQTFGRAVSAADYAALALSFPGVAKASAAWIVHDPVTYVAVSTPYIQLTVATQDQTPLSEAHGFAARLRAFLDGRRDPNVPLRICNFTPIYVDVTAEIDIEDRYPPDATLAAVRAALNPGLNPDATAGFFAFERLQFGQSIHLSAVYAALQSVPGVRDAGITTLRQPDRDPNPATVRNDIFVPATGIAVVKNDPGDVPNQYGKLTITRRSGGFVDT